MQKSFGDLEKDVIEPGLCTLCGTCVGVCPTKGIAINFEQEEPELIGNCSTCGLCYEICPGKEIPLPDLDRMLFGRERSLVENKKFGIAKMYLKGYATDSAVRNAGASGGVVSALLICALEQNIIDGALVVAMSKREPWKAEPRIVTKASEIVEAAKSKYVMVPVNSVLSEAIESGFHRLGMVGCPCHIHALRKMKLYRKPKNTLSNIEVVLGLFCGVNYSFRATEHILKEWIGIPLNHVNRLEYRGGPQSHDLCITTTENKTIRIPWIQYRPFMTAFQRDRCMMCYDWAAELSDLSIGDMFSFQMVSLNKIPNWSSIIVRTKKGEKLINEASRSEYVKIFPGNEKEILCNVGYEEKKHGNAHRIIQRKKHGWPTPNYGYPIQLEIRDPLPRTSHLLT